jgi:hypothetical protein
MPNWTDESYATLGKVIVLAIACILASGLWMVAVNRLAQALGWTFALASYALKSNLVGGERGAGDEYYCAICDEWRKKPERVPRNADGDYADLNNEEE